MTEVRTVPDNKVNCDAQREADGTRCCRVHNHAGDHWPAYNEQDPRPWGEGE